MRRLTALVLGVLAIGLVPAASSAAFDPCAPRLLVLSAFPGEIDMLFEQTDLDDEPVEAQDRIFYTGSLRGHDVALALTGIGMVNSEQTARAGLEAFACDGATTITGIVFSGVSGGKTRIGDVTVPMRWTPDGGDTWQAVDPVWLAVAGSIQDEVEDRLGVDVPTGDPACLGLVGPRLVATIELPEAPAVIVGGDGGSTDPFGGRRLPCIPGGGDVFGCRPCRAPGVSASEVERLAADGPSFVDPDFFFGYFANPPATSGRDADDMETAAAAAVAEDAGLPFIAFRALSDGDGDPLMLPGFPFQFFYYRQVAADNAAIATLAFLDAL